MIVNNVTRLLDARKIAYEQLILPGGKFSAAVAAEYADVNTELIFKTIVLTQKGKTKGKPILAVVPGDRKVDLKKTASVMGVKKIQTTTQDEAEKLTGLKTGGISPLALLNMGFAVLVDRAIQDHDQIFISGGQRDLNLKLAPDDLLKVIQARLGDISTM